MRRPRPGDLLLPAFIVGGIGLAVIAVALATTPEPAIRAWHAAAILVLGLSLGAIVVMMIAALTGGAWSLALRPPLLAMAGMLPLGLAAMLVPALGMTTLLPWIGADAAVPEKLARKLIYFSPALQIGRLLLYGSAFMLIGSLVGAFGRTPYPRRLAQLSVIGLIVYALAITFFSTDWLLALDPLFSSTVYGMLEASGELVGAFAAGVLTLWLAGWLDKSDESAPGVLVAEDLANLLFGFDLIWVYLAFMQWLVVWSGDLPDEIGWYLARSAGLWQALLFALLALHAGLPIVALLSRRLKRSPRGLAAIAAAILLGHVVGVAWRVGPAPHASGALAASLMLAAFAGLGGVWTGGTSWLMLGRPRPRWRKVNV
jgi:hypothetical protein